ncbi:MAG: hypothetical protein QME57_05265, partial [Patescibacteria group bacterium]|nr:hypothetical protein [Patescibacteria group bacterium]
MIIGVKKLLRLVKERKLVENLSERELKNPEGAGFDLRIGELYQLKGKGFLGLKERKTLEIKLIAKYNKKKKKKVILQPPRVKYPFFRQTVSPPFPAQL